MSSPTGGRDGPVGEVRRTMGLRGRAVLHLGIATAVTFALILLVDAFGVPWLGLPGEIDDQRRTLSSTLELVSTTKAERLVRWFEERRDDVEVFGTAPAMGDEIEAVVVAYVEASGAAGDVTRALESVALTAEHRALSRTLAIMRDTYGVYEHVSVALAGTGLVLASTDRAAMGRDVSGRPDFARALAVDGVVLGAGRDGTDAGLRLTFARRVEHDGEPAATVILAEILPADVLGPLLYTGGELGSTGEVLLFDGAGTLLAPANRAVPVGAPPLPVDGGLDDEAVARALGGESGTVETADFRGVEVLATYRPLRIDPDHTWGMVVKQDTQEAYGPIRRRAVFNLGFGLLGSLVILGLSFAVISTLTRPLRELGVVAEKFRSGDLAARSRLQTSDEFGVLSLAMNAMLDRLERRQPGDTGRSGNGASGTHDGRVPDGTPDTAAGSRSRGEATAALFRKLLDRSADEIYVFDVEGRVVDCNATARERLGYEADEIRGLSVTDFVEEGPEADAWASTVEAMHQGEVLVKEGMHRRQDGSAYPVEATAVLLEYDDARYVVAVARDVSERVRLDEERRRLATAVEQAADAVVITDTEGLIVYVNKAFETSSGYSGSEVLGRNPRLLKSGEHDAAFYEEMWSTLGRGEVWKGRIVNRARDGTLYREDATITPLHDEAGRVVNYVAVKQDVTRQVEMELQLRQSQKMEAIGQLAAGVAHDFNNLLTGITGYSELLRSSLGREDRVRQDLEKIIDLSKRAASLTRQLLVFSRRVPLQPVPLKLNDVVDHMSKLLTRLLGEHIEVELDLAEELGTIEADPGQIEQIIMNLCVNARDAMPTGGRLTLHTCNVDFDREFVDSHLGARSGPHVGLIVSDTGVGMDATTRQRIFEPFFTTKEVGRGTGLGLATVHGIVRQHEGSIWVYSEPGEGTTFKVYFPRVETVAPAITAAAEDSSEPLPGGHATVLVVEDEPGVRGIIERILGELGYRVLVASNPAEARAVFAHEADAVDLLLTDVVMPGEGGQALYEALSTERPGLPVIFMSGYTDRDVTARRLDPSLPFLQKPFTPVALARKLQEVLQEAAGRQAAMGGS